MFANIRLSYPLLRQFESSVDSSLALTPSDMSDLSSQGRAVSLSSLENLSYFSDEQSPLDLPIENTRGIDINTLWSASQRSKSKLRKFRSRTVNTLVDGNQLEGGN